MTQEADEIRFRPTSGRIMGSVCIVAALSVVAIALLDPGAMPAAVVAGIALFGVLAWASMLWPGLSMTADDLVLRTMAERVRLPLAAIEDLAVRQVLAVRVGDRRYVSTAIGRSWRKTMVGQRPGARRDADRPVAEIDYPDYVEQEIRKRMEHARAAAGVRLLSDEQLALAAGIRRQPAWPPIVLIAAAVIALLVSLVV